MAEKLDIFRVLNQADRKSVSFYEHLSEEEKKAYSPFLVQRWLSGTSDVRQVVFLNEILNPYVFSLQHHKQLLWFLTTICTNEKPRKYFWNKLPGRQASSKPETLNVISQYFGYSKKQASDVLNLLTYEDINWYAEQLGKQPDELAKLKKEWKNEKESSNKEKNTVTKNKDINNFFAE